MKVMTLNIAHGHKNGVHQALLGKGRIESNLSAIAAVLRREQPDVVALQEADGKSLWSGRFDHVAYLAEEAGMSFLARSETVQWKNLSYGTALLSRHPLEDPRAHRFAPSPPTLPKGMVVAGLRWPDPSNRALDIASVHLDFSRRSVRRKQVDELIERLSPRKRPLVLMGDFNCGVGGKERTLETLAEGLDLRIYRPMAPMATYPLRTARLDWIFISRELQFRQYATLPDVVSDHRAVVATLGPA